MRLFLSIAFVLYVSIAQGQERETENVIIVTLDGFRWREIFEGADKNIIFHDKQVRDTTVRGKFWDDNLKRRREKLFPFLWTTIGKEGQLYGNRKYKNKMRCTNANLYSYSGYSEMFVGYADDRIKDNTPIANPNYTVLEYINALDAYANSVAVFSTWGTMPAIFHQYRSKIFINSGPRRSEAEDMTEQEQLINQLTMENKNPYGERYDKYTFGYAFEYLKRARPRVMFVSLDETDEHGHGGRYDEYLKSAHCSDSLIGELWTWIQNDSSYRNKTTLLITTDHGRGTSKRGWRRHAMMFRGSAQIWMAVIGPDTPATGEMKLRARYGQNQIAKTIASLLDVPYQNVRPIGCEIGTVMAKNEVGGTKDEGRKGNTSP